MLQNKIKSLKLFFCRNTLVFPETDQSPSRGQQPCWIPVKANHFPATSPFIGPPQTPVPPGASSPVALIPVPVIVPTLPPPPAASRPARRPREVKFDESKVWHQLSVRKKRGSSFRDKKAETTPETIPLFPFRTGS